MTGPKEGCRSVQSLDLKNFFCVQRWISLGISHVMVLLSLSSISKIPVLRILFRLRLPQTGNCVSVCEHHPQESLRKLLMKKRGIRRLLTCNSFFNSHEPHASDSPSKTQYTQIHFVHHLLTNKNVQKMSISNSSFSLLLLMMILEMERTSHPNSSHSICEENMTLLKNATPILRSSNLCTLLLLV